MIYLLLPGRQIVTTASQETYLAQIMGQDLARLPEILGDAPRGPVTEIVFAVTSCNKSNSRYNPLPFEIRAIIVYEFARRLKAEHGVDFRVIGIPNYRPTQRFAELGEIEAVRATLAAGFTIDCHTPFGRTALETACRNGDVALVGFLLEYGGFPHSAQQSDSAPCGG
ncbi:MAG TPA: hypothetical protein VFW40_06980 [Capsulimonadaceae bacterium]|nr:hypothetical protein [Capsulimonadaceae bacterium]